jgi:hypothetical protein
LDVGECQDLLALFNAPQESREPKTTDDVPLNERHWTPLRKGRIQIQPEQIMKINILGFQLLFFRKILKITWDSRLQWLYR